ncbi:hypothetical protein [Frondihabitans sp. PAMC 28766]|uniref:hypothetical protein n=1 Tax=Frondihabitans sp. PAMC 28766 TaxID=1795630 RepID=UPI0012FFA97F|nr:hypothetical protein [Frondihabitans sp. PAMC 28766]
MIAYMLPSIDVDTDWSSRLVTLLSAFPTTDALTIESMGAPKDWEKLDLWHP